MLRLLFPNCKEGLELEEEFSLGSSNPVVHRDLVLTLMAAYESACSIRSSYQPGPSSPSHLDWPRL